MNFFKNKLAVTIVVLSVSFLILIGYSVKREKVSAVENGIGSTFNFVEGGLYSLNNKIKDMFTFITEYSQVKEENKKLKEENYKLEKETVDYKSLKEENDTLKDSLNYENENSEYNYVTCDIVGKSGGSFLEQFVVNRGSKNGIAKGMVVITAEGLVGKVTYTSRSWSVVESLASENIAVGALVQSTRENQGIVKGYKDSDNKLLAKLSNLPVNSTVKKGDVILTSGTGLIYPKDIRIGKVIDVETDTGKAMKIATIEPYVNFSKLEVVTIVVPKNKINISSDKIDIKY